MSDNANQKLEEYKNQTKKEAEKIVKNVFPARVLDLHTLLVSTKMNVERLGSLKADLNIPIPDPTLYNSSGDPGSKKRKLDDSSYEVEADLCCCLVEGTKVYCLPNGTVPCNSQVREVIGLVKPHIVELIDHANQIKMWIAYSIPRIEDGNNFGVSIQEETMAEARQVETEAATYLDQVARYHITRGKLISKVAKYPHVDDYRQSITELDEKEFISLRLVVCELRNHYASLHDLITKNLDKIKKPRNSNAENLY